MSGQLKPKIDLKRWGPDPENFILQLWSREGIRKDKIDPLKDEKYVIIDTPPPYPSGRWGVAQAGHYAQIDMVARGLRLLGYKVFVPFYADRNGLPAEVTVEKKYGILAHEIAKDPEGREKFLSMVKKVLDDYEADMVRIWGRLGCWFNYIKQGTDSPEYRRVTQATFLEMWRRGLIHESEKPVAWCPRCRTSLSEAEIEFKRVKGKLYYLKYRVAETGDDLIIATTRPELLNGCEAVIYNPGDSRYKHLKGKHAVIPLYEKVIPIIESTYANPEFGTGLAMMCSYGDTRDIWFFREKKLNPTVLINPDGTMNEYAGFLKGLKVEKAREVAANKLEENGFLAKVEEIEHEVPVCWRCKTPIEFIHVKEYFLKQLDFKDKILKVADEMEFVPEEHKVKFIEWVKSLSMNWPISRTRFYGTEIPIWRCNACGNMILGEEGKYVQPWKDDPPVNICSSCGAPKSELVGEKRTFDTWFDSSISVLYITGWLKNRETALKALEHTLRPQGYEIIRTWLYFSVLRVWLLTGKPPFKWVRISGMGLDAKGRAMHKSLGNIIYPMPFIKKYGADAFRYWAATASKLGSDYRWSENLVRTGLSFATKLVNIGRYISLFNEPNDCSYREIDKAMLSYASEIARKVASAYEKLDVYKPSTEVYELAWNVFASNYLETVKARAYGGSNYLEGEVRAARCTLHKVYRLIIKLISPIMPFVADYVWRKMYSGKGVHYETLTSEELNYREGNSQLIKYLLAINSGVWKYKKQNGLKLKESLNAILYIPKEAMGVEKDLKDLHKISEVVVGPPQPGKKTIQLDKGIYLEVKD